MLTVEDEGLSLLHNRLHAMRRALGDAYDRRDALAREIAAVETAGGVVRPDLLIAFNAAERAVLAAEAGLKDAEYALTVANEGATVSLAGSSAR